MTARTPVPVGRLLMLGGAVVFGAFFVVAFCVRQLDMGSEHTLSVVGGVLAWVFLAYAAVVGTVAWRRRSGAAERAVCVYLERHPGVMSWLGTPVRVQVPGGADSSATASQQNVTAVVTGPLGQAQAHVVLARLGRSWEVLQGELEMDGSRVRLTEVAPGG